MNYLIVWIITIPLFAALFFVAKPTDKPFPPEDPIVTPQPTPEPTPTPTPKPALEAPAEVKVGERFTVRLRRPFKANTVLFVDGYKLGTMGHERDSDFMVLSVSLNTAGRRILMVDGHTKDLLVSR